MVVFSERRESSYIAVPLLLHHDGQICTKEDGKTNIFKTCFNGLNALSGVGLLSIPYALSSGGWLSLILLFVIATATFFTGMLIKLCMDLDFEIKTYPDIGRRAFGSFGKHIISIFMYSELYLVSTGFLIMEGDNLQNLFPKFSWIYISGKEGFIIIMSLIILPTIWLDDLRKLSYVSATGVISSIILILSVLWTGTVGGIGFQGKGKLLKLRGIPTAFSLYTFCYCAHPVFPTLYTSMRDKSQFNKVLLVCFVLSTAGYTFIAVLGYSMYGERVHSQITLNLPVEMIASKIAIYTTLVNPLTKYALMVTPIVSAIENHFDCRKKVGKLLIRTLLLISTVIVAVGVPFFGDLMSLVGALLSVMASIIFPCICYLKISQTYKIWSIELLSILVIILMGISMVIIGTYTSLCEIIVHFRLS